MSPEEIRLIHALKHDERHALQAIFHLYHAMLCRVSHRILNDPEEAKDVVQEVFVKLWRKRNDLIIEYSLQAYLRRAVVNTSINRLEQRTVEASLESDNMATQYISPHSADARQAADELAGQIQRAVQSLPPRTRTVFGLVRFEGMTYQQVSDDMHISVKAVEKEMMKALKLLRVLLRDYLLLVLAAFL